MNNTEKTLDTLRNQYFDAILNPIEEIYADIEVLQDIKLGALMSTITVQEEMDYIYSQLKAYDEKLDLSCAKHFPVLNKTDEQLLEICKKDPFKVAYLSPWTNVYSNFHSILSFLIINNKTVLDKNKFLHIVINCSDIDYPLELFDKFVKSLRYLHPRIDVKLSHKERYNGTTDFYNGFNMFFIYDHEKFLNNEKLLDSLTTKDKYSSKILYTVPVINEKLGLDKSEYPKALASTSATLNLFCDFFYMQGGIPLGKQ